MKFNHQVYCQKLTVKSIANQQQNIAFKLIILSSPGASPTAPLASGGSFPDAAMDRHHLLRIGRFYGRRKNDEFSVIPDLSGLTASRRRPGLCQAAKTRGGLCGAGRGQGQPIRRVTIGT